MRRRHAAGALAVLGVVAVGFGATYAGFSSTEQEETTAGAATLDLRLSTENDAEIAPLTFGNLQPGDVRTYHVQLTNDGTIPGEAFWAFQNNNQERENGCLAPESAAGDTTCGTNQGELGNQLAVTFSLLPGPGCTGTPQVVGPPSFPSAFSQPNFQSLDGLVLGENDSRCVQVDIRFQELGDTNNRAQGDSSSFGFRFQLVQVS